MLNNAKFEFTSKPELFVKNFLLKLRENGDFWRMHLDYCKTGMNNELGVYSHMQNTPDVTVTENETVITYPSLIAEDGSKHSIKLILKILQKDGALYFSADMDNNSQTRITSCNIRCLR